MANQLLERRKTHFVLWQPAPENVTTTPQLVIGVLAPGNPASFKEAARVPFAQNAATGLWEVEAARLVLPDGVYHYWFEMGAPPRRFTDPHSYAVNYDRTEEGFQPASVIAIRGGDLTACDPEGGTAAIGQAPTLSSLAPNNQLVIYELPASWSRAGVEGADPKERDVGSFQDVMALLDSNRNGANFEDLPEVSEGQHLVDLGINALELLPVADTKAKREWGYATAHYLAVDHDLGKPSGHVSSSAQQDFTELVRLCHGRGIRVICDVVMAFGHDPYGAGINFKDFHIDPKKEQLLADGTKNPEAWQSSRKDELRDAFGGHSWRYGSIVVGYDPATGQQGTIQPATSYMFTSLERWMTDFHVDGFRRDSTNNVANWDFLADWRVKARDHFKSRYQKEPPSEADARFLVIDEELAVPLELLKPRPPRARTTDALWNEHFRRRVRAAIVGESEGGDDFEWTVRRLVDCRLLGFTDGAEAINYLGSHDTQEWRQERLYDFLESLRVHDKERRAKLAFACLLTSVGIPMIFAGDEFLDMQDRPAVHPSKQLDPVNFARKRDPWRMRLFEYVANLVRHRIRSSALGCNDTAFVHFDFDHGRRVAAWVRGRPGVDDLVVVVANFSDQDTPGPEYVVKGWPATPPGKKWREITQGRDVPAEWVGREPLFHWEAKIYTTVPRP